MKPSLLLLLILIPSVSFASLDMEYVVQGGFSTVVNAFTRIKFMFNDRQYSSLMAAMVVFGIVSGLMYRAAKGGVELLETGKASMGLGWLAYTLIGTMIWFGLMVPKGTIHIYDQTRNQYQPVSGIPDFITFVAGGTNLIYQAFTDMANTNTATTTRFSGEGMPIKVLMALMTRNGASFDPYISKSITEMWKQCSPIAETRGFDANNLKTGSTTFNIVSTLSALRNPAVFTTWYSAANPGGSTVSCTTAYSNLQSAMGSPTAYDSRLKDICSKLGYNSANAASYVDCKGRMEDTLQTVYGSTTVTLNAAIGGIMVSQAISDALVQQNPEVAGTMLANRSMVNSALSDASTNPEWLTTIMAGVMAIILSMTPMLILLVVTPLMGKALTLLLGMWVFLTAWQVADTLLLQAATDEILTVMSEIKSMGFGLDAMQLAPTSAQKAMTVTASARTNAVYIATLFAGLFGVSAYGLTSFASKSMQQLDRASDESSKSLTNEGRGGLIEGAKSGLASQKAYADIGDIDMMARGSATGELSSIKSNNAQVDALGGDLSSATARMSQVSAGSAVGNVRGTEQASQPGQSAFTAASESSSVSTQGEIGRNRGVEDSASAMNMSVTDQSAYNSAIGKSTETGEAKGTEQVFGSLDNIGNKTAFNTAVNKSTQSGEAKGVMDAAGNNLGNVESRQSEISSVRSAENIGEARGTKDAFGSLSGIESSTQFNTGESKTQGLVDNQRQRDQVETISAETGSTIPEARRHLSNANSAPVQANLAANGYDGQKVIDTATYDAQQHVVSQHGERAAFAEQGVAPQEVAGYTGYKEGFNTVASNETNRKLSTAMDGEDNRARAEAGANHHMALNKENAEGLHKAGIINEEQLNSLDGGGRADFSMISGKDGNVTGTSAVHSGQSTSADSSATYNSQSSINKGLDAGSAVSQRNQLFTKEGVRNLIDQSERNSPKSGQFINDLAHFSAESLTPFTNSTKMDSVHKSASTSLTGGTPGSGILGFGASATATVDGSTTDQDHYNQRTGQFKRQLESMSQAGMAEADKRSLHGADKDNYVKDYVADNYSKYYQQEYRNSATETMKESSGSAQAGRDKEYNQQNALYSQPGTYTFQNNHRPSSAQEYAHILRSQGEGQLASDKFEYGQIPQQTTRVSPSTEPEIRVREKANPRNDQQEYRNSATETMKESSGSDQAGRDKEYNQQNGSYSQPGTYTVPDNHRPSSAQEYAHTLRSQGEGLLASDKSEYGQVPQQTTRVSPSTEPETRVREVANPRDYQQEYRNSATETMKESSGSDQAGRDKEYNQQNGSYSQPDTYTVPDNHRPSSAQEYAHTLRSQGEGQLASDKSEYGQVPQQTTRVSPSTEPETRVREVANPRDYQQEYRNSATETMKESSGSDQAGRDKEYNQQNGSYSQPGTYTVPDNHRPSSAQEYEHTLRSQQGEGQLASDKSEYGQVPQQTTRVSPSTEPETRVREVANPRDYQQEYRNSATETMKESSGSDQAGRDKEYNQQNGSYSQPGTYTVPDNHRPSSAQEYEHTLRSQQGEGQLASDKSEYGQVPQQTTRVSPSAEPETKVKEVRVQANPRMSADTSSSEAQPKQGMNQQSSTSSSTMPPVKGEIRSKSDMPPVGKK
ncbi:conjugal transfer protein TraG N-terminal domain-containing protein [Xenorhabdus bovienii]|uniref:conjugal transfer protein TraG N-terminal domain-containing protein n=1 Tax=Xenorhabdus bovienii TaxID=40576 RepID=UPI001EDDDE99|nr:conjugal transfer protein TraG N-terminal domain-containing protein [Xenorhabdus bovienii]MCG3471409.1 conjugal transfer protein TraG N-terminal domain-containing protein [Xenorhabdus bovienii]